MDAPRRSRMIVLPSPRGYATPPSDGASRSSNSARFVRFDLRALLLPPPRPNAPAVPPPGPRPRPPPPGTSRRSRRPPGAPPGPPPGRWKPPPAPPGRPGPPGRCWKSGAPPGRPAPPGPRDAGSRGRGAPGRRPCADANGLLPDRAAGTRHALVPRERVVARARAPGRGMPCARAKRRCCRGAGRRRARAAATSRRPRCGSA